MIAGKGARVYAGGMSNWQQIAIVSAANGAIYVAWHEWRPLLIGAAKKRWRSYRDGTRGTGS